MKSTAPKRRSPFAPDRQGVPNGENDTVGDFSSPKRMVTADRDLQRFLIRAYESVVVRFDADGLRIGAVGDGAAV